MAAEDGDGQVPASAPTTAVPSSAPRRAPRGLWAWPTLILLLLAPAGHFFGPYGALTTGVVACMTALVALGRDVFPREVLTVILALGITILTAATFASTLGIEELGTTPLTRTTPTPTLSPTPAASPASTSSPRPTSSP